MKILFALNEDGTVAACGPEIPEYEGHFITNKIGSPIWKGEVLDPPDGSVDDYYWDGAEWVLLAPVANI
jgi:hypothetical protein